MAEKRANPFIWATWIAKAMAGDACLWQYWYRAHHKNIAMTERSPEQEDKLCAWTTNHTALLLEVKNKYLKEGYTVLIEDETTFQLLGKTGAIIAGRCDLICLKEKECIVIDIKTGKTRLTDQYQVQVYMIALSQVVGPWTGKHLQGLVIYPSPQKAINVQITRTALDLFKNYAATIANETAPSKLPTYYNCRYCEIVEAECPDKITTRPTITKTDLF